MDFSRGVGEEVAARTNRDGVEVRKKHTARWNRKTKSIQASPWRRRRRHVSRPPASIAIAIQRQHINFYRNRAECINELRRRQGDAMATREDYRSAARFPLKKKGSTGTGKCVVMATPFQTCGRQRGFPARLTEGHEPVCALCDKNIDRVGQKKKHFDGASLPALPSFH